MQKITPFLWFNTEAEEAMNFYISIFKNSKVNKIVRWPKGGPAPEGSVLTVSFQLNGQDFVGLNGGPQFKFTEAVSFVVGCKDQEEIDYYWEKLGQGGEYQPCGWLKDKFGLSWQVVPENLPEIISGPDTEATMRATQEMMKMSKLDIRKLRQAYQGEKVTA